MKIGVLAGTFNPIHNGHILIAKECIKKYKLSKVIFVTSSRPVHKSNRKLLNDFERYRMVAMACSEFNSFDISPVEMTTNTIHYSYKTIDYFKNKHHQDKIYFIIGEDSFDNIHTWEKGYKLLDLCKYIVVTREQKNKKSTVPIIYRKKVSFLKFYVNISATSIRNRLKNKKSIKGLVSERVEKYIKRRKYYT